MTKQIVLGISAFYHDSAAAILVNGELVAAAQEERFTRLKHDEHFPVQAIRYVLEEAGVQPADVQYVAFYEKPYVKFERLLETYHAFAPKGLRSFLTAIPVWIKEKLFLKKILRDELHKLGLDKAQLYFPEHHLSHAASAFYPSSFQDAAILTVDGVGEWATTTIAKGSGNTIEILRELHFPHSLGLLYSAFTYYCGFRVNSGEYKLMGLAPYGNLHDEQTQRFISQIKQHLVDIRPDGSLLLNMAYFDYATGLRMCNNARWKTLFGVPVRSEKDALTQDYMNLALACQKVTEEIICKMAQTAVSITGCRNLVMAGGVALNSVANNRILEQGLVDSIWVQPAAGDAGGAIGAALAVWHIGLENQRVPVKSFDAMQGAFLGPSYSSDEAVKRLKLWNTVYERITDRDELSNRVAGLLDQGNVVGWFQGRMEFGPRALGARTILADPRNPEMQRKLNLKIKYREGFRPFAPSVLEEDCSDFFNCNHPSPYMLFVVPVNEKRRTSLPDDYAGYSMYDKLYFLRSDIPSITHIDYSARIQTVSKEVNPEYWRLINAFKRLTGYGLVVNTSFNVRGEPIVCTPEDAYRCFMNTEMDYLVIEELIFDKRKQPIENKDKLKVVYKPD